LEFLGKLLSEVVLTGGGSLVGDDLLASEEADARHLPTSGPSPLQQAASKRFKQQSESIRCMETHVAGEYSSKPEDWVSVLSRKWYFSWKRRPHPSEVNISHWVAECMPRFDWMTLRPSRPFTWERLVHHKGTAAGPDLIPFAVWEALSGWMVDIVRAILAKLCLGSFNEYLPGLPAFAISTRVEGLLPDPLR
jgi:hypothetical protein